MKTLDIKRNLVLIVVTAAMMAAFAFCYANASTGIEYKIDIATTLYHNNLYDECPAIWVVPVNGNYDEEGAYIQDQAAITAKSSNPKVIKVSKNGDLYEMVLKKPGKTRITVTFKDEDGNTRTLSKVFRVKKYPDFIKSLRINGKKMNLKADMFHSEITTKKTKARVKFSLKKGWKKTYADGKYCLKNGNQTEMPEAEVQKVLQGKAFKFPKKYRKMYITVMLEKGDDSRDYLIELNRK